MGKKEDLLFEACMDGDLEQVIALTKKSLFSKGADINAKDKDGNSPLLLAATAVRRESMKKLMDSGAIPRKKVDFAGVVGHLIDCGADINAESTYGGTALCQAVINANKDVAVLLLNKGAKPNAATSNGGTPLFFAVQGKDKEIIKMLLEKGADVNAADDSGKKPLLVAAEKWKWDAVKNLIAHGADIDVMGPFSTEPGIFGLAINDGEKSIVKLLIEKKVDINRTDWRGYTPLMYACQVENQEIVSMLIKNGADVNKGGEGGLTPLMIASALGAEKVVAMLLERGAALDVKNNHGNTALIEAIVRQNQTTHVVETLLTHGAPVNAVNDDKKTALTIASERGFKELVDVLVSHGAEGKTLRPEFSGFSEACIAELEKILAALSRSLDAKLFIKALTGQFGFSFDEENMIGAFFKSLDAVLVLKAGSSYRITACSYAQKYGGEGANRPLVESAGGGLGRLLYPSVFEYRGSNPGQIPVLLHEASELLLFSRDQLEHYTNRQRYDRALFEKAVSPMKAAYYLKGRSVSCEYPYLVVHTGEYSAVAADKFGSEYGPRIFSECFPALDPSKDWDIINGKQVVGNYAPEGYEISDFTLFDSLMAQIVDGEYLLEHVLRA
jgi:ankyrin repeat protein